ncbi:TPA: hypothetical protein DF272_00705 [Candidatus Falkowbacteria bacterium]|nr:hypothetical protein [Candidatus Falkowbacteria bacterium]
MKKIGLILIGLIMLLAVVTLVRAQTLTERTSGKILLQVEEHGEAWYVYPLDGFRYYLGRPDDAFTLMRELGLGVNNENFDNFNGKAPERLAGRILLKVEDLGKAYYVKPEDLSLHYLGRPLDAFNLMREMGLGITTTNLMQITIAPLSQTEGFVDCGQTEINGEEYKVGLTCINQKFAICQPATYLATVDLGEFGGLVSYEYKIIGLEPGGCLMQTQYIQNPNPEWIKKKLVCHYDNTATLSEAHGEVFDRLWGEKIIGNCTGELAAILTAE